MKLYEKGKDGGLILFGAKYKLLDLGMLPLYLATISGAITTDIWPFCIATVAMLHIHVSNFKDVHIDMLMDDRKRELEYSALMEEKALALRDQVDEYRSLIKQQQHLLTGIPQEEDNERTDH